MSDSDRDSESNNESDTVARYDPIRIQHDKDHALAQLGLSPDALADWQHKLRDYRYIDRIDDLDYGGFLRWVPLSDPSTLVLTRGAHFCEMSHNGDGLQCKTGSPTSSRYFTVPFSSSLVFQRLRIQEKVAMRALSAQFTTR
jgi:hypothetical protein